MNEPGTRIVKTLLDHALAPESNIMLGEDVHYPGKWAGFPSHSHPQPEIYFYKFQPENGFGLLKLGDEGVLLEHNDTVTIAPDLVHPQVAAPGYAMYFLWIIRHLDGNPYIRPILSRSTCGSLSPAPNIGQMFRNPGGVPMQDLANNTEHSLAQLMQRARAAQKIAASFTQEKVDELAAAIVWEIVADEALIQELAEFSFNECRSAMCSPKRQGS